MDLPPGFTHIFYCKVTTVFDTKLDPNMDLAWNHTKNVRSAITNPGNLFCSVADPGLCTPIDRRYLKYYKIKIDNFASLLFCFHTFGVRRPL